VIVAVRLPIPSLQDSRRGVRLRPWRDDPADVAALVAAWHDPLVVAHNPVPRDTSPDAARRWIAGDAERRARGLALDLVIAPVDRDDVWGEVGLRGLDRATGRAEAGWWLAAEARGRGLAAAALDLLATWALSPPLGLRQVWARIDTANRPSAHAAAAAGFRRLGAAGAVDVWSREAMPNGPPRARQ
jgi:[ribosomal protein S5]-alanine N-acetyltransferase